MPTKELTVSEQLAEAFPDEMLREHPSKGITYVQGAEVLARLNRVLGVDGWSYRVLDRWETGSQPTDTGPYPKWVMASVRLEVLFVNDDGVERTYSRDGVGGHSVEFLRSGDGPVDLGDSWKAAITDALKKAAQSLGVALDLARKEEAILWERRVMAPKAEPEVGQRIAAALDTIKDEKERRRAKGEYLRRFGRPDALLQEEADEAVAWVEVRTGITLTEPETEPEADAPAEAPLMAPEPSGDPAPGGDTGQSDEPLATKAALADLKAGAESLQAEGQETFKAWWRENVGVPMDSGQVTIAHYEAAAAFLAEQVGA